MSYLIIKDVVDQTVSNTLLEVPVFNGRLPQGIFPGNVLLIEQTARYQNANASGRNYTMRLKLDGKLIIKAQPPPAAASTVLHANSQRWELSAVATDQLRAVMRWAAGGTAGTAQTLQTSAAADDIVDCVAHGFHVNQGIMFSGLTGGAGLSNATQYFVTATSFGADTFRPAATQGGAPINFTTDITAGTVATSGSDTGNFTAVTTPGAGGSMRYGDKDMLVTDMAYIDLSKPLQLEITVQLSHAAATHQFMSMGVWGMLLGDGLTAAVRPVYPANYARRRAG